MRIGKVLIDTKDMSIEELDTLIKEMKHASDRKREARARKRNFVEMLTNMKEEGFTLCSKYTGEVLNADEWLVWDEQEQCAQNEKWVTT